MLVVINPRLVRLPVSLAHPASSLPAALLPALVVQLVALLQLVVWIGVRPARPVPTLHQLVSRIVNLATLVPSSPVLAYQFAISVNLALIPHRLVRLPAYFVLPVCLPPQLAKPTATPVRLVNMVVWVLHSARFVNLVPTPPRPPLLSVRVVKSAPSLLLLVLLTVIVVKSVNTLVLVRVFALFVMLVHMPHQLDQVSALTVKVVPSHQPPVRVNANHV